MKRALFFIALSIVFALPVAAQTAGGITGTVSYGDDKAVMHDVTIQVVELRKSVSSDQLGVFRLNDIPAGTYRLVAHMEGFADASKTVTVTAGRIVTVDFELRLAGVNAQVTVTASGTEQSAFEAIESVSSVDSSQITARAAIGLGDVLENESGVSKRSSGPGASRPVIRGFDGDRVLVSNDGVRNGSLASQSGDHAEPVDTLSVERIEVVKGPATLLYGSNAIGGVVNAISGHDEGPHPGVRGSFSVAGGTNSGQASAAGRIVYGVRNWMFWGNTSGQRTGDYTAGGDFGRVFNTATNNVTASTGFGYFASKAFFTGNYSYYKSRYGIPLDPADPARRSLDMHRNDFKTNFGYDDQSWFVTGIKFTLDASLYQHQELEDRVVGTTFRNNVYSYRGMFEQKAFGRWSGRFGVDGYRRNFSTVGSETLIDRPVKQDALAVFALEELKFERISIQLGGRVERNAYDPENPLLPDRSFTGFSGAVGFRADLWKGGAFVANYSHASRAPALEELYNNGPHDGTLAFEIGNPDLKVETNDGLDLSIRQQNRRVRGELTFYYYNLKNYVFLAPTGVDDPDSGFPIARYLQGNSRFVGSEFSIDVTANKYLNIFSSVDYVNAQLQNGTPLPRIAPMRARVGFDLHVRNFSFRPEFAAVARQDRVFINETPTAGYGTVSFTANYVISQKHFAHIFSVSSFNLNNKLYYNHISFIKDISPEIGRGARFSYTVRFF